MIFKTFYAKTWLTKFVGVLTIVALIGPMVAPVTIAIAQEAAPEVPVTQEETQTPASETKKEDNSSTDQGEKKDNKETKEEPNDTPGTNTEGFIDSFQGFIEDLFTAKVKEDKPENNKINICHKTENGWNFMETPAGPSLDGHLGHGDFLYVDAWGVGSDENCSSHAPKTQSAMATIVATKIVCDREADLPNWGAGGQTIDATTATAFLASPQGQNCDLVSGWQFEWGDQNAPQRDNDLGPVGNGYNTSDPTNNQGVVTMSVPIEGLTEIHVREVMKPGYIGFTGQNTTQDVSAEFYCTGDALNYDNWDFIRNPQADATYYCVAFNAPTNEPTVSDVCMNSEFPGVQTEAPKGTKIVHRQDQSWCVADGIEVNICKEDEEGNRLSGWTLMLKDGDPVQTGLTVPSNLSVGINSTALLGGISYIAEAIGTWFNQGGANIVDAEYSTTDNWATHMDGYTGYTPNILELQINQSGFGNWGSYNNLHKYAQSFTQATNGAANFRIYDGSDDVNQNESWFADNSGDLSVTLTKGWSGITDENGCVTFDDVPFGNYKIEEVMQDGWHNVSLPGTEGNVQVYGLGDGDDVFGIENFTVVNAQDEEGPAIGRIKIEKYVCPADTVVTRDVNGVDLTVPEGCVPQEGAHFGYVHGTATDANGPHPELSAPVTAAGVTGSDGVLIVSPLEATGRYLVVETDENGNKLAPTDILGLYCQGDGDTNPDNNDNQEITFVYPGKTAKCVAYNKAAPAQPTTLKVHIYKHLKDGDTTTQIPNGPQGYKILFPMVSSWSAPNIGSGSGVPYVLGNHEGGTTLRYAADTSAMQAPADYTTSEVTSTESNILPIGATCVEGKYRLVGYKSSSVSLEDAESNPIVETAPVYTGITTDRWIIVVNEECPEDTGGGETTSSNTTVVTPANMQGWEFNGDRSGNPSWTLGTGEMVAGPSPAPLSTGSAHFATPNASDRIKLRKYLPIGMQISDITALKYSTYRANPNGGALAMALQFDVNFTGTPIDSTKADGRIVYEPYHTQQALIVDDAWQEWDALNDAAGTGTGAWWIAGPNASTCPQANPCTWAELNANYPDLQISAKSLENTIDTQGAMLFKAGGSWDGFDGNVDKFIIGIKTGLNTHTETYDFEPNQPAPVYACSNGIDDDGDGLVDANDPGCHSDGDAQNVSSYDPADNDESNSNGNGGNGGNGGGAGPSGSRPTGTGGGQVLGAFTGPEVLGASACSEYITDYIKLGKKNDLANVFRLQLFLNEHLGMNLPITGVYSKADYDAVKAFQVKHNLEVLMPWKETPGSIDESGTGYVYKTTKRWINMIKCPELNIPQFTFAQLN